MANQLLLNFNWNKGKNRIIFHRKWENISKKNNNRLAYGNIKNWHMTTDDELLVFFHFLVSHLFGCGFKTDRIQKKKNRMFTTFSFSSRFLIPTLSIFLIPTCLLLKSDNKQTQKKSSNSCLWCANILYVKSRSFHDF